MYQQQQSSADISDDQIIEQALACTRRSGWTVLLADCRVQSAASEALTQPGLSRGAPDAWIVHMWAHPHANATLLKPMPLACRVQLLDGRLCAVNLYEPSDREPYLR